MRSIFISHSSKDAQEASDICTYLERNGIECWIAPRDIDAGSSWSQAIVEAIDNCSAMVLVLSGNANLSDDVLKEVNNAANKNKAIFPVRIENIEPSKALEYHIHILQWIDIWHRTEDDRYQTILRAINNDENVSFKIPDSNFDDTHERFEKWNEIHTVDGGGTTLSSKSKGHNLYTTTWSDHDQYLLLANFSGRADLWYCGYGQTELIRTIGYKPGGFLKRATEEKIQGGVFFATYDATYIATCGTKILIWNLADLSAPEQEIEVLDGAWKHSISVDPSGRNLAVFGDNRTLYLIDLQSRKLTARKSLDHGMDRNFGLRWSSCGQFIALQSISSVLIFDNELNSISYENIPEENVSSGGAFSKSTPRYGEKASTELNGQRLDWFNQKNSFIICYGDSIYILEIDSNKNLSIQKKYPLENCEACFLSPNETYLAVSHYDHDGHGHYRKRVTIMETISGKIINSFAGYSIKYYTSSQLETPSPWSPDSSRILLAEDQEYKEQIVTMFDPLTGTEIHKWDFEATSPDMVWSPKNEYLLHVHSKGIVKVWRKQ